MMDIVLLSPQFRYFPWLYVSSNGWDVVGGAGEIEAEKLKGIIDKADSNAKRIAEFAVGTNPRVRLTGNLAEDKKRLGSVHFAIGDNDCIGGVIRSGIHLDGVMLTPTVVVDGKRIVNEGHLSQINYCQGSRYKNTLSAHTIEQN